MSTLFLSSALGNLGNNLLGPLGKFIGSQVGYRLGNKIDKAILYGSDHSESVNVELKELNIQTYVYGKMIPIIFGTAKLAGNIIWMSKTKIVAQEISEKQIERFDFSPSKISINYVQHKTFAIAICEGEISELVNIFVNDELVDKNSFKFRIYKGTETQEVDYLIQSIESEAPAYRGIAYIVIEDFPISTYGNRIPNFTFEVRRKLNTEIVNKVKNINIIPGSGEFVYDTKIQFKLTGEYINGTWVDNNFAKRINQNTSTEVADSIISLDSLQETFPKLEWVSVVVSWFTDALDIGKCTIYPAVEYQSDSISDPNDWQVNNIKRLDAHKITLDNKGNPIYGGTTSDSALLNFLEELRKRKYKIMLYPMLFVDSTDKPWRGHLTGNPKDVKRFFEKYNKFILHYAELTKNKIDGIIIGSEMKGITSIKNITNPDVTSMTSDYTGRYPGVEGFTSLAVKVNSIVSSNTVITYAADWSEYHSYLGEYNMDLLWSVPAIDFIGIDAYFPLTDTEEPEEGFSIKDIKNGWNSKEGYDYYYTDPNNKIGKINYTDSKHAWKNIKKWWEESHINPDGSSTLWTAKMKKIWFLEYGFASVDGCCNEPNVFIDKSSTESKLPHYSKGNVNFISQINAIYGTLLNWENSEMVEKMFLWCWDARPYPYFPHLKHIWNDWSSWETGHWVQGKIMLSSLKDIIDDLAKRANLTIEFTAHNKLINGYVLQNNQTITNAITALQNIYFFDVIEKSGKLHALPYINITARPIVNITNDDISDKDPFRFSIMTNYKIPSRISIIYMSADENYQIKTQSAERNTKIQKHKTIYTHVVLKDSYAKFITKTLLYKLWNERVEYKFSLVGNITKVEAGDIISFSSSSYESYPNKEPYSQNINKANHLIKVQQVRYGTQMEITGNSILPQNYDSHYETSEIPEIDEGKFISSTSLGILDLPNLPGDPDENYLRFFATSKEEYWFGCRVFYSFDNGKSYKFLTEITSGATVGTALSKLQNGPYGIFDEGNKITIILSSNKTLSSNTKLSILNGENLLMIGSELVHFTKAEFLGNNRYLLSSLLRGCYGTEAHMSTHTEFEKCILIDKNIKNVPMTNIDIGKEYLYKAISLGSINENLPIKFTYNAIIMQPFSVVGVKINRERSGNINISWIRRSRIDSNWLDKVDISLNELFECYEIDIIDTKTSAIKRTLTVENKVNTIYNVDDQVKDFTDINDVDITISIYQLSRDYGRGDVTTSILPKQKT